MPRSGEERHDEVVAELRALRVKGLLRLRGTPLPELTKVAAGLGLPEAPSSIASLIGRIVEGMDGTLAEAAAYTFGVAPGTGDWPAQDRRKRAAEVYGVSVERFRKSHEVVILEQIAERIVGLAAAPHPPSSQQTPVAGLALGHSTTLVLPGAAGRAPRVTVHRRPVEAIRDIDVLVSSENVYLEMSKTFHSSLSASLRSAAARRDPLGAVIDDVLQRELRSWLADHHREGMPVTPGTVVPTSPGELASCDIRRIYHAAVAVPRPRTNDYDVEPAGVIRAVHNVFVLARAERTTVDPPLRSICLPLFGAGRGGLSPETALAYLWEPVRRELLADDRWDVHLLTRSAASCAAVLTALRDVGAVPAGQSRDE
ncbi:hypothetical protein GCM10029978_036910 [Actinoallomurus acanthiterrae]